MGPLTRLPIRVRLTLAFAAAMALVLIAVGVFLYLGLAAALDQTIDEGLRTRADDVTALVWQADSGLRESGGSRLAEQGEGFAQVLDASGSVVDTTPQLGDVTVLPPHNLARALQATIVVERQTPLPGINGPSRILATPVQAQDRLLVVVVGASLEGRDEAVSQLLSQLLVGGPVALVLTALLAYALAAAALRPVESMRRQAAAISAAAPGRRLPVPAARDEVARLGETLNDMLARLEAAIARERSFVSDASHELRTPLSLLKGELDLALARTRSVEELEQAIRSASAETDRLAQLAEDLLILARSDQGRLQLRMSAVQVRPVLEDVRERFARRTSDIGTTLTVVTPAGLTVAADRLRLEQALGNLVENALRHGNGPITLTAAHNGVGVDIHVLDRGPGFPPAFLPRAFERFTRADDARSGGGAGLGLAIVAVIAHAHGGSVRASDRDDGGADLVLSLPAGKATAP